MFDKWLFVLHNLGRLMERPSALQERYAYEESLKAYRDLYSVLTTAEKKGREEGCKEGEKIKQLEIGRNLKSLSLPLEKISEATGLSAQEIKELK